MCWSTPDLWTPFVLMQTCTHGIDDIICDTLVRRCCTIRYSRRWACNGDLCCFVVSFVALFRDTIKRFLFASVVSALRRVVICRWHAEHAGRIKEQSMTLLV